MIVLIIINILLITISGAAKAISDVSIINGSFDKLSSLKQTFWRKSQSSSNKWKNNDPNQGEKFFGSSTFLVFVTDAWHLFDVIRDFALIICGIISFFICIQTGIHPWVILIIYPLRQIIFELTYTWLRKT